MNRREFIQTVVGTAFLFKPANSRLLAQYTKSRRPNIIFIMADDVGYNDLACYGQRLFPTPFTDRLAKEGTRFTDAYSPSAVCTPTRYAVLTGTDPFRRYHTSHVLFNGEPLLIRRNEATVASLLQSGGYRTGVVGKWHLGLGDILPRDLHHPGRGPNEIGFDYSFIVPDGHNMHPQYYIENGQIAGNAANKIFKSNVKSLTRLGYQLLAHEPEGTWPNCRPDHEIGAVLADKVDTFIEQNKESPFFLYYPTCSIHFPFAPDKRFKGKSEIGVHGDYVMEFDWAVGRVMETLDRLNLAENTLLIVTSDNGGYPADHPYADEKLKKSGHRPTDPWREHKDTAYEGGVHVPFLARWPGHISAGQVCSNMFSLVDFTASATTLAGIALPQDAALDSFNILPILENKSLDVRPFVVTGNRGMEQMAIRRGVWKLVYWPQDGHTETYDLAVDPAEQNDLADSFPDKSEELLALLKGYIKNGHSRSGAVAVPSSLEEIFRQKEERNVLIERYKLNHNV